MRIFWIIIGIFLLFAGFIAWAQMAPERHSDVAMREAQPPVADAPSPSATGRDVDTPIETEPGQARAPRDRAPDDRSAADRDAADEPDERQAQSPSRAPGSSRSGSEALSDEELKEIDEAQKLADDLFDSAVGRGSSGAGSRDEQLPDELENRPAPPTSLDLREQHEHQPERLQNPENPWEVAAKQPDEHQPLEHSVQEKPDGTIVLDETFEIRGKGTRAEPYQVTWDLLLSAAETYQPRLGMTDIPERIQMLDGKHVRISGHLLFPMVGVDAREVLVMLNMWDGCCLGTMPSPYDAIEVELAQPFRANQRNFMNHGTLEGRLTIDPYLINDWLLGLYVMEDARLDIGM